MSERPPSFRSRRDDRSYRRDEKPKASSFGSFIGWSIFILLLVALVALCWLGTYYVFGHPEEPTSYALLQRMNKVDKPRRFIDTAAPRGEFLSGTALYERFNTMTDAHLKRASAELLRDYIRNYKSTSELTPYIIGRFNILDSYSLTKDDFFQSGVVALAQDTEAPQVLLEHVFTADERMVPVLHRSLLTGLDIPIKRTYDLSAVINVRRLKDGRLVFTAIPLHYPSYTSTSGPGGFALEPPPVLNVQAGLPLIPADKVLEADQRYAAYRRKQGLIKDDPLATTNPIPQTLAPAPADELIRVQTAVPVTRPTPAPVVAAAEPLIPATQPPVFQPPATVDPSALPTPEPALQAAGSEDPATVAMVAPTPDPTPDVLLKPFKPTPTPSPTPGSSPAAAVASTSGGKWQTFRPGQMPRGRLVNVREAQQVADKGTGGERVYLQGNFVVTASGADRAVLRPQGGPLGIGGNANTRIIVDFPAGSRPPGTGANLARGADRPFLVTDVKRTEDGQINVFVREVTAD